MDPFSQYLMRKTTLERILGTSVMCHISVLSSVYPSAQNNSNPTQQIFVEINFGIFTNMCWHILLLVNVEKIKDTLYCVMR